MKKLFLLFLLVIPINLFAVSKSDVDYEIYDYIVDASVDVSGNLNVKEIIGVKGTFNGYIRDLVYKNDNINEFTGDFNDFKGSSIYNGSNIVLNRVGVVNSKDKLSFDSFNEEIIDSSVCSNSKGCYLQSKLSNGVSLKMYNETEDDITYFYIEYMVGNVVVIHEDVAEVYFNFIGDLFDDEISNYKLRFTLPSPTKKETLVWAHGPVNGNVSLMGKYNDENYFITESNDMKKLKLKKNKEEIVIDKSEDITFYGAYLTIDELDSNTPVDLRMVFDKDLIMVEHPFLKKSGVSALSNILEIEKERANVVNERRKVAKRRVLITYSLTGMYLLGLLVFSIYVYIKHDKEKKSGFDLEYNREFIDDYDVTVIEYLFNMKISERAFSTSILNMIYKKNISFEKINDKDYILNKVSEDGLDDAEKIIMNIIFDEAGDANKTTLGAIKKYAKKVKGTTSPFLNKYSSWKSKVTSVAVNENFYEDKTLVKVMGAIYSALSLVIISLHAFNDIFNYLTILLIIFTIVFLIYVLSFNKRTIKGALHYSKWKAFKRFLLDFGRFDEKDLPDIVLWERYLVYANIFGIADKVGKLMKVKFNEMNLDSRYSNHDIMFDYMIWFHLNSTINNSINSVVSIAHTSVQQAAASTYSSGGGFGGGFSSGGGFGGGGGGGRGF